MFLGSRLFQTKNHSLTVSRRGLAPQLAPVCSDGKWEVIRWKKLADMSNRICNHTCGVPKKFKQQIRTPYSNKKVIIYQTTLL